MIGALTLRRKLRRGCFPVELRGGLLRIFGDVYEDRAGTATAGDDEGFANGAGDVFGVGDHDVVLGDRHRDPGDVDFLKRVRAEDFAADLTGDADDRGRIQHGRGDARDHVRGAGAGGGHGNADAAAGAGVTVRHVRRTLLVAHKDVVQLRFAKRIVDRKNRAAGIAENFPDAQARQRFAKDFRTGELHSVLAGEPGCTGIEKVAGTAVTAPREEEETSKAYLAMTPLE